MSSNGNATSNKVLAQVKQEVLDQASAKVKQYVQEGKLHLPADYSPGNALNAAWLILQDTKDRNDRPVLESCTRPSIWNALLAMVIQGLNPIKNQCYFIAYGNKLVCQPSYFGDMLLARRVRPDLTFEYEIIYEGDKVKLEIRRGKKYVVTHEQDFANMDTKKIKGAYCFAVDSEGEVVSSVVMTIDRIQQSWSMSPNYKPGGNGPHQKFADDFALRTVIRKCSKPIYRSSPDPLFKSVIEEQDAIAIEAEVAEDAAENANRDVIGFDTTDDEQPAALESQAQGSVEAEDAREPEPAAATEAEREPGW